MKSLEKDLSYIKIDNISFDPNNPRGEDPNRIENDKEFDKLVASINKYGLLEPLIVKKDVENEGLFILVDGERRLRAAIKVSDQDKKRNKVPILLAKDDIDGRILAYQVHMLRKNWSLAAETKAIKQIIIDLREELPGITNSGLKKKIIEITAHKSHELDTIFKFIEYDDDIIDDVLTGNLDQSYLVQIESNFMNPLKKYFPLILAELGEVKIRQILISKAKKNLLVNTRFLMDKFKIVFKDVVNREKIEKMLLNFINNENENISKAFEEYKSFGKVEDKTKNKKITTKNKKQARTEEEKKSYFKKIEITTKQQTSITDIVKKIESIAKKYTKEESEYISESIFCLKNNCYKATTLMIWASAISRILFYVEKNLDDFNTSSNHMRKNLNSFWKHFSNKFKTDYTDTEEIRVQSNDIHLLCYLCFKKIISVSEFKKLKAIYDTRNDCAHPTGIEISVNEIISALENIFILILNNEKLK